MCGLCKHNGSVSPFNGNATRALTPYIQHIAHCAIRECVNLEARYILSVLHLVELSLKLQQHSRLGRVRRVDNVNDSFLDNGDRKQHAG
jgi:hypothetical protein